MNRTYVLFGLALVVIVSLFAFVNVTEFSSDCFTTNTSIFVEGVTVCWGEPIFVDESSVSFEGEILQVQKTITVEALKLGYYIRPDGTFEKVMG